MAGTLLVHGIALDSIGWGSFAHITRAPEAQGIGSVRVDAHAAASEELVLLNLDSTEKADVSHGFLAAALRPALTKPVIDVQVPEPVPTADDSDVDGSSNYADAGDAQARALMAGRYRAQVSARVERAWVRPRTPVDESKAAPHLARVETPFICQVQIRQDARGNVQEVMLLNCNGTEAWRHSLVVAINQASPLPAPPIPSVFAPQLAMTFEAQPYEPGAPADEYERQSGIAQ